MTRLLAKHPTIQPENYQLQKQIRCREVRNTVTCLTEAFEIYPLGVGSKKVSKFHCWIRGIEWIVIIPYVSPVVIQRNGDEG